jgi:hydrogenase maturation protease
MTADSNNGEPSSSPPRIVIIGVGNLLLKDEGVGIHAVRALQEMALPPDVRLIDGGTSPDLIAYTKAGDKLIIVDCAKAGGEPGIIYRFRAEDLASNETILTSAHELGVPQNLALMSLLGNKPEETVIIGVEPADISPGLELSAVLAKKLPQIVKIVLQAAGL